MLFYQETPAVAAGAETVVLTYTVSAGVTLYLSGFSATGGALARFRLFIDGAPKAAYRTSHADRNAVIHFPADETVPPGAVVQVRATNYGDAATDFEATIYGTLR